MLKRLGALLTALILCSAHGMATPSAVKPLSDSPELQLISSLIAAGGGARDFKCTVLIAALAGPNAHAEIAKMTQRYGAANVKQWIVIVDFTIADSLRWMQRDKLELVPAASSEASDEKALFAELYSAGRGRSTAAFSLDNMLERVMSHTLHAQVTKDIDARYGATADARYQAALSQLMHDLNVANELQG